MRQPSLLLALLMLIAAPLSAAPSPAPAPTKGARTIHTPRNFPKETLRRGINAKLFRSLGVSPIEAWIVARAPIAGGSTRGAKVVQSDAGGAFDEMALALANNYSVSGTNSTESRLALDYLDVHLLIYKIADGYMAICFSHIDDSRYADYRQGGLAWVAVHKAGKWTRISADPPRW